HLRCTRVVGIAAVAPVTCHSGARGCRTTDRALQRVQLSEPRSVRQSAERYLERQHRFGQWHDGPRPPRALEPDHSWLFVGCELVCGTETGGVRCEAVLLVETTRRWVNAGEGHSLFAGFVFVHRKAE